MNSSSAYQSQTDQPGPGWGRRMLSKRRFYLLVLGGLFAGGMLLGKRMVDCYIETRVWGEAWSCMRGHTYHKSVIADIPHGTPDPEIKQDYSTGRQGSPSIVLDIPHAGVLKEDISDLSRPWYWPYQPLLFMGLAGVLILGYLFYEWYLKSRRVFLRELDRQRTAPLYWDLKVSAPLLALAKEQDFRSAVQQLQERAQSKAQSTPAAYLVLIEKSSPHDHLAMLYDQAAHYLWRDDFPLVRYFFQQDPRACFDEKEGESLFLNELYERHPDTTLIVVSGSQRFFDPLSGELLDWVDALMPWDQRVLMIADPPLSWGYREKKLQENFVLLPASIEALGALGNVLGTEDAPPLSYWLENNQYPPLPDPENEEGLHKEILAYLSSAYKGSVPGPAPGDARAMKAWFGACALYPELTWDLTLALGQGIGRAYQIELCTPRKLYKLVSLSWFREGFMPDNLRMEALQALNSRDVSIARQVLVELLEANPPPDDSYAASEHQLFLAIQENQLKPGFFKRMKLARQLQDYTFNHELRDQMSLQFLRRIPLGLPNWLRDGVFIQGIPALGLQKWVRASLVTATALLLLLNVDLSRWMAFQEFNGQHYYVETDADKMRFYNHQGNVAVARANLEAAQQYYQQSQQLSEEIKAEDYVAPDYNLGVVAMEKGANDTAKLHFDRVQEKVANSLAIADRPEKIRDSLDSIALVATYNEGLVAYRSLDLDSSEAAFRVSSQADSLYAASRYAEGIILLQKALGSSGADRSNKLRLAYQRFEEAAARDTALFTRENGLKTQLNRLKNSSPDSLWQDYMRQIEMLWQD